MSSFAPPHDPFYRLKGPVVNRIELLNWFIDIGLKNSEVKEVPIHNSVVADNCELPEVIRPVDPEESPHGRASAADSLRNSESE